MSLRAQTLAVHCVSVLCHLWLTLFQKVLNEFSWLTRNINHLWWKIIHSLFYRKGQWKSRFGTQIELNRAFDFVVFNLCQFIDWTKASTTPSHFRIRWKSLLLFPKRNSKLSSELSMLLPEARIPRHHSRFFWVKQKATMVSATPLVNTGSWRTPSSSRCTHTLDVSKLEEKAWGFQIHISVELILTQNNCRH